MSYLGWEPGSHLGGLILCSLPNDKPTSTTATWALQVRLGAFNGSCCLSPFPWAVSCRSTTSLLQHGLSLGACVGFGPQPALGATGQWGAVGLVPRARVGAGFTAGLGCLGFPEVLGLSLRSSWPSHRPWAEQSVTSIHREVGFSPNCNGRETMTQSSAQVIAVEHTSLSLNTAWV